MDERQEIRTIASRVRQERLRLEMTQPTLARLGGVSKTTQSGYESALHVPDALYLARASQHGLDPSYVVTGVESAVRAGADLDWDHLAGLIEVLDVFTANNSLDLDSGARARLLRLLYAATIALRRVEPAVVRALLADAA